MTDERKPWEEQWYRSAEWHPECGDSVEVVSAEPHKILHAGDTRRTPVEHRRRRAALAAAAPDLYRALAGIEWVPRPDSAGNLAYGWEFCPSCDGLKPRMVPVYDGHGGMPYKDRNVIGETMTGGHRPNCALAAALRKARGET